MAPVTAAKFQRWAEERTITDSSSGVHQSHAAAVYGHVVDCKEGDGIWEYRIQAADDGRQVTSWILEHRVVSSHIEGRVRRPIDSSNSGRSLSHDEAAARSSIGNDCQTRLK